MKRMYQIGLIASLAAMLPTGLFAGNGDGDGKDSKNIITIVNTGHSGKVTLSINSAANIDLSKVEVYSKNGIVHLDHINSITNGIEVGIDVDHSTESTGNGDDDIIIIEIVGVDNITGVDATDNNNNDIPTSFTNVTHKDVVESTPNEDNPNGFHGNQGNGNGLTTFGQPATGNRDDIQIYPNPIKSETNVVTVGEILGKTIQIMDLSGHLVLTTVVPTGSRQTVLDLSGLNPGLYILSYFTEDGRMISKRIQKI